MTDKTPTPHIGAKYGEIAETVIMSGDPLRAQFMAEHFLDNPVLFNKVRGMLGFTGTYKGKRVSVMGHGMGVPSMAIYSYELFNFYGVKKIIRVGSAGSMNPDLHIGVPIVGNIRSYCRLRSAESSCGEGGGTWIYLQGWQYLFVRYFLR